MPESAETSILKPAFCGQKRRGEVACSLAKWVSRAGMDMLEHVDWLV
jgi:hypothetical protein